MRRAGLLVPALTLVTVVTALVSSLGAPLVPSIAREYDVSIASAQWTLSLALLTGAVSTPLVGRLGGNRLRRRTILIGLLLVLAGCVLAAAHLGFGALLAGRTLQGVGMALSPLAFAVAREALPPARRTRTIALLSVSVVAGAGLGYPTTSWIAHVAGLSAAFWTAAALCVVTLALAAYTIPESRSGVVDTVDWWGAVTLALGTGGLLLAISQGESWGWGSLRVLLLATGSAVVLAVWVARTLKVPAPLVDLRLAVRDGVAGANITGAVAGIGTYLLISLVMLTTQLPTSTGFGLGESSTVAGLLLVPYSLCSLVGSRVVTTFGARVGPDFILPVGCTAYLISTLSLAVWHDAVWQVALVMAIAGVGSGSTFAAMPPLIVRYAAPSETSSAIAFNLVLRLIGFSAGSALAPALLAVFAETDDPLTTTLLVGGAIWVVTAGIALGFGVRARRRATRPTANARWQT